jgi:hypothetical protein
VGANIMNNIESLKGAEEDMFYGKLTYVAPNFNGVKKS